MTGPVEGGGALGWDFLPNPLSPFLLLGSKHIMMDHQEEINFRFC